ncbi:unnamed protein product [Heterobilharzia americana]|nr:unnamed protein product [Heterobilharzia americana]
MKFLSSVFHLDRVCTEVLPLPCFSENFLEDSYHMLRISFMPNNLDETGKRIFIRSLFPENSTLVMRALGGLLFRTTTQMNLQRDTLTYNQLHIVDIQLWRRHNILFIDKPTLKHLQILKCHEKYDRITGDYSSTNLCPTLFKIINHCLTSQGILELEKWMRYPLCDKTLINQRLDAVEFLLGENAEEFLQSVRIILKNIGNLQVFQGY